MFPTPPSHEHNPISSPCGIQPDTPSMESLTDNCLRRPHENYPVLGSPPDEPVDIRLDSSSTFSRTSGIQQHSRHSQDWSYVYKPPAVYKMLGSSKYAPLSVLPSQQLPPLTCPISNATYTPSWQFIASQQQSNNPPPPMPPAPVPTPMSQQQHHPPSSVIAPSLVGQMHLRPGLSPISPVPSAIRGESFFCLLRDY